MKQHWQGSPASCRVGRADLSTDALPAHLSRTGKVPKESEGTQAVRIISAVARTGGKLLLLRSKLLLLHLFLHFKWLSACLNGYTQPAVN